jgi:hypothetical protein
MGLEGSWKMGVLAEMEGHQLLCFLSLDFCLINLIKLAGLPLGQMCTHDMLSRWESTSVGRSWRTLRLESWAMDSTFEDGITNLGLISKARITKPGFVHFCWGGDSLGLRG